MSSSSTETTIIDVTMPQMGVSVAEGTVVEWKKQPGDWVEADEIIASISTDKIDTDVEAPATGRVQELLVDVGATVEVGTVLARIATDAKPGEAHRSEDAESADADSASSQGTSEAAAALDAPGEAGELQGDTADEHAGTAQRGSAPARRSGSRRYSPVVMRIASEHGVDLDQVEGTGRGGRVRKQDVLAFIENGAPRKRRRCTSRAPTGRTNRRRPRRASRASRLRRARPGRRGQRTALAHAPVDRRADAAVAPDRGDLHDDRRGGPGADRGRPRADGLHVPALHRPRDDRHAARVPAAQRHARGRHADHVRRRAPRHRGVARQGRPDRAGHSRRAGAERWRAWPSGSRTSPSALATTSSRPTRSAAARSRSPTPAATARSSPRR